MNVLEKILEEIEKEQNSYEADHAWNYSKGMEYAKEIIRAHMDEAKDTNVPSNDDDYTMFTQNEDGVAEIYCDTYDIIIHCGSSEEQKRVGKILERCNGWISVEERLPEEEGNVLVTVNGRYKSTRFENAIMLGEYDEVYNAWTIEGRLVRYCCSVLKETGCANRYIATGVRWDESASRKRWNEFSAPNQKEHFSKIVLMNDNDSRRRISELCMQQNKMVVNPIIDWTHSDVWEFINSEHIETCELYKCGYDRVGCIGCPMASKKRYKEFADFPEYKKLYIHAFERMLEERKSRGKKSKWKTGEEVFLWWMKDENIPGQMSIEDFL